MSLVSRATKGHIAPPPGRVSSSPETGTGVSRETPGAPGLSPPAIALLAPIRAYRRLLSPVLASRCRFYPSCSAYAEQSIRDTGAVRGTILALWRVLRCNPFTKGGLDPVEDRLFFRSSPTPPERTETA